MRFSVIIPVYNVEKYLADCINSVMNQSFNSFEVILVNDGSTDSSGDICKAYMDQNRGMIRLIEKRNGGLISARREGIKYAKGDYCVSLDSDDILSSRSLEVFNEHLLKYNDPDILIYNLYYMNADGSFAHNRKPAFPNTCYFGKDKQPIYRKMVETTYLNPLVLKVIKRELIQKDPTDYTEYFDNNFGEDILQSLYPVTEANSILYIPDALYGYRMSDTSMTRNFSKDKFEKRFNLKLQTFVLSYMQKWGLTSEKDILSLKARNYIVVMENILTFIKNDSSLYKQLRQYSKDYCKNNSDIRVIVESSEVETKKRVQLYLFSKGCLKLLLFANELVKHFN